MANRSLLGCSRCLLLQEVGGIPDGFDGPPCLLLGAAGAAGSPLRGAMGFLL